MSFLRIHHARSSTPGASKIRGVRLAIVVDNNHGDGNRGYGVKLKLPWLNEQEATFWARIAVPMGGPDRGTYVLPEIDDQLLVVFEHGDISRPIVVGALWSKQQEPVEKNQSGANNTKLIKSRSGHRIIFDDKEGAEKIIIVDKTNKNKLILDSANKIVKVESDGDIDVVAKDNIILHANALQIGTSEGVTGKGKSLLVHSVKTLGLKASSGITIGGGSTTINTSSAAATSVSGSHAGELGGAAAEPATPLVAERSGSSGSSTTRGEDRAATRGTGDGAPGNAVSYYPPLSVISPTPPDEEVPLTTLEVVVVDDDGSPIRGVRFEVVDPAGTVHEGTTNPEGLIRLDGLLAGECEVVLFDLALDN